MVDHAGSVVEARDGMANFGRIAIAVAALVQGIHVAMGSRAILEEVIESGNFTLLNGSIREQKDR